LEVSDQRNLYDNRKYVANFVVRRFLTRETCVVKEGGVVFWRSLASGTYRVGGKLFWVDRA
jgi:hypothetical protein